MLRDATIFSSFSTDRLQESYAFYKDILGLHVELVDDRFLHVYLAQARYIVIYQKDNHAPSVYTTLNFQIQNIEETVDQLASKGIVFFPIS